MNRVMFSVALCAAIACCATGSSAQRKGVNHRGSSGFTQLLTAVVRGDADTVKALIAHHADLEAKVDAGKTALMLACFRGRTDIARALISAGPM